MCNLTGPCTCMTAADQTPATAAGRMEQIRARAEAATPGPWINGGQGWIFADALRRSARSGDMADLLASVVTDDHDSDFIAHARDDIPWLLALIAEQAATIERVRGLHKADRGMPNACCECGTRFPCETITALGSHRTEGQG